MKRLLNIADLFCGAGGTSTGAIEAAQAAGFDVKLTAVNHWPIAVATHERNHPGSRHFCVSVDDLNPRSIYGPGELDLLWASPECTHHSRARGGKPMSDQSRATGHCVTRWAEALQPSTILVENVPEFLDWGPLGTDGKPLKSKKGSTFKAWVGMLESLGYKVAWRLLRAADFGDPTTRTRLFVQAVRGRRKIVWPNPTHAKPDGSSQTGLFGEVPRWRNARDIIEWDRPGKSIFARKKPLAPNTMARIMDGLRRFGIQPSVVVMENGSRVFSIEEPLRTITTAKGGAMGLAEPYLVQLRGTSDSHLKSSARSVETPVGTVSAGGIHHALVQPCLLPQQSDGRLRPVSEPVPAVATRGAIALVEPYLVEYYGNGGTSPVADPVPTVTAKARFALALPEITLDGQRYQLDIRFRMLTARELARAQGFPDSYQFTGKTEDVIRQIGNAVPRRLARAIVHAALTQNPDVSHLQDPSPVNLAARN